VSALRRGYGSAQLMAKMHVGYRTVLRKEFKVDEQYPVESHNATHATLWHPDSAERVCFTRAECWVLGGKIPVHESMAVAKGGGK
jgi:hypothetical protein